MTSVAEWLADKAPTLFGGGVVGLIAKSILDSRGTARDDKRDDFNAVLEAREREATYLGERLARADARIEAFEQTIGAMGTRIQILEVAAKARPIPEWSIDRDGRYTWCNEAFASRFLEPRGLSRHAIVGKTHADVWLGVSAETFAAIDREARSRASKTARRERVEIIGEATRFLIAKWAVHQPITDVHIGFYGMAIPDDF